MGQEFGSFGCSCDIDSLSSGNHVSARASKHQRRLPGAHEAPSGVPYAPLMVDQAVQTDAVAVVTNQEDEGNEGSRSEAVWTILGAQPSKNDIVSYLSTASSRMTMKIGSRSFKRVHFQKHRGFEPDSQCRQRRG